MKWGRASAGQLLFLGFSLLLLLMIGAKLSKTTILNFGNFGENYYPTNSKDLCVVCCQGPNRCCGVHQTSHLRLAV